MACLAIAGCGTIGTPTKDISPERQAQLHTICADTMKLSPGTGDCAARMQAALAASSQ